MHIIKLNAIGSTNSFLRELNAQQKVENFTIVVAESQSKGRGQMGTLWDSQPGKNLTASVAVDVSFLPVDYSFWISMAISLALSKSLKDVGIKSVKVKWPNDILAGQKKICGILIDNVIKINRLQTCIIGFGLNVNQVQFDRLPLATSMKIVSGKSYDLDVILEKIILNLQGYINHLELGDYSTIKSLYETELFRKDKPSTFKSIEGDLFSGFIKGVSKTGRLNVLTEDAILKQFDLKEVKLLY